MMNRVSIRAYEASDAKALADIYYNTIHNINISDYSIEQVNAWAPISCLELEGWQKKWQKLSPIVAMIDKQVVGFAEFADDGHIDCFYVHHKFQKNGVGSALMQEIERQAVAKNITKIFAEVSITAKSFFLKQGFRVLKEQMKNIRGIELKNFVMEKIS